MQKTRTIEAMRAGRCGICGEDYSPGTRIAIDNKTRQWVMADCLWPDKARDKKPRSESELSEVSARLDAAVGILCHRFNIPPSEVKPDSYVLAEIMRELYGQQWLSKEMRW